MATSESIDSVDIKKDNETVKNYPETKLGDASVLVIGEGKSCDAAISLLSSQFKSILQCDKDFRFKTLKYLNIEKVIIPPGLSLQEKLIQNIMKNNIPVYSEVNFGLCNSKGHFFGITGSNGKTTTTMLVKHLLSNKTLQAFALGNCGTPLSSKANKLSDDNYVALELSSFMLELPLEKKLESAVVLNLSPDHLNRYKNIKEYYRTKFKIYDAVKQGGNLIFNADDKLLFKESKNKKYRGKNIWYFSLNRKVKGIYKRGRDLIFNDGENDTFILNIKDSQLKFGTGNIAAAVLISILAGVNKSQIVTKLACFKGVEHRISTVLKKDNITYINDSKATNCESTIFALNNLESNHVILLLGGSSKKENYDRLFKVIKHKDLKSVICFGRIKEQLEKTAKKFKLTNVFSEEKMKDAVVNAKAIAESGDIILLSPAAASFDEFTNFEERGDVFTAIVKKITASDEDSLKDSLDENDDFSYVESSLEQEDKNEGFAPNEILESEENEHSNISD